MLMITLSEWQDDRGRCCERVVTTLEEFHFLWVHLFAATKNKIRM